MSGEYDYMIKISALSIEDFFSFASEVLGQLSSVRNYQSQFILKRIKDDPRLPQFVLDEAVSV
ncbi:Lrp/AsnC family transcriptional regulator [Yangia sp. PrR004]|nr:Lrp/AsnC family transcriptional regulator [Salipiger sp. PrR004]